jgi:hypothetical protein
MRKIRIRDLGSGINIPDPQYCRESPAHGPASIAKASILLDSIPLPGGISCKWSCKSCACVNLTGKHPTSGESPARGPASIAHASILLKSIPLPENSCTWSCKYCACVNLTEKHPTSGEFLAHGPASIAHASILLKSIPLPENFLHMVLQVLRMR